MQIIDGKILAARIKEQLKAEVNSLIKSGITPKLSVIIVGENKASLKYVSYKEKSCNELGIKSEVIKLPETVMEKEVVEVIEKLNTDSSVNGILVQLPLPRHINQQNILSKIEPSKDVDGFTPYCLGRLLMDIPLFIPCTPKGIIRMLDEYGIETEKKRAVVVGRSIIVGKPLALLLMRKNATVTVCHSKTESLEDITRDADILCVAIGKPNFINARMVKRDAIVIDVGINVGTDGKVTGDVDFKSVSEKVSFITPVPGGVGPMTIAMLMENTVEATKIQRGIK
ncbi:bifunctional methylenetetrahydrofolate dehydrogenase/methenyltetrahydrofolate cyclohydrolase FolD [Thermodesulfovibrio sp.]|jgi:methylenetetrahydrofolate dehydrogenase (NADP+)/methenyltetrahydrofolate cyclohydrolase|uniref:bifunctional methylenetetrahydrofolate dehydrogenase/methenyltetrahydrofolate cyclohydrolase FolD n=1 Tax=Thermodesulfovibrio TaxID=28261 RepID=UPI002606BB6A|nr:bifunctional methylenetetrahydrofolate dehydrogenase/methenyltetrahydrofolate cyclohydrolase FolD [Thermodesulfovibrio sp.]